jgi:hypothetical protein
MVVLVTNSIDIQFGLEVCELLSTRNLGPEVCELLSTRNLGPEGFV